MTRIKLYRAGFWIYLIVISALILGIICMFSLLSPSPPPKAVGADTPPLLPNKQSAPTFDDLLDVTEWVVTFDDLLDAIEWVESKGDANAVGDYIRRLEWEKGWKIPIKEAGEWQAIGAYQLHKIYVDDYNMILKSYKGKSVYSPALYYTYQDRWDKWKSRQMVHIYLRYYSENKSFEQMARIHNGGPNGYKKESTKPYWLKVKARLESLR